MKKSIKQGPSHHRGTETQGTAKPPYFLNFKISFLCVSVSLWLIGFGLIFQAWADAGKDLSVGDVSKKVEDAQAAVTDVQMDINMEMKDSLSGDQQNWKGKVKMKSPDLFYVHYTQPGEQFLYIDGKMAQMYQPDQKMVYQQHGGQGKDAQPVYLGVGKELKKYITTCKVSITKNSSDEVQLLFIPHSPDTAGFDKMKVFIHKKDWWPYQMELETTSMTTKSVFSNFTFNKGLKESLFQFTPPKGVQVVEGVVY